MIRSRCVMTKHWEGWKDFDALRNVPDAWGHAPGLERKGNSVLEIKQPRCTQAYYPGRYRSKQRSVDRNAKTLLKCLDKPPKIKMAPGRCKAISEARAKIHLILKRKRREVDHSKRLFCPALYSSTFFSILRSFHNFYLLLTQLVKLVNELVDLRLEGGGVGL